MAVQEAAQGAAAQVPNFLGNPQALVDAVVGSLNKTLVDFVNYLPNLITGVVWILVGVLVANVLAGVARRLLNLIKLEEFLETHKIEDALGNVQVSNVLVQLTKYFILLVFVQQALALLVLGPLTEFVTRVIDFAPKVMGSIIVVVAAAVVGEWLKEKVLEVHEKEAYMRLLANGTKYLLVFFGIVMGLDTIGFPTAILINTFTVLIGTIGAGIALAFGLAFGLGSQETAKDWVKEWRKRLHV